MSSFSETLRDLLEQTGLKQAHLADTSGVDKTLISRFLSGVKEPSPDQVAALCVGLGCDPETRARLLVAYLQDKAAPVLARGGIDDRHVVIAARDSLKAEGLAEPGWWETAPDGLAVKLEILGKEALKSPAFMALIDAWVNQVGGKV